MACCCGAKRPDEGGHSVMKEQLRRIQLKTEQTERILDSLISVDPMRTYADQASDDRGGGKEEAHVASLPMSTTSESMRPVVTPSKNSDVSSSGQSSDNEDKGSNDNIGSNEFQPVAQKRSKPLAINKGFDFIQSSLRTQTPKADRDAKEVDRFYQSKMRRASAHQTQKTFQRRTAFLGFEYDRQRSALISKKIIAGLDATTANAKTAKLKQRTESLAKELRPWKEKLAVMRITHKTERESFYVSSRLNLSALSLLFASVGRGSVPRKLFVRHDFSFYVCPV